MRYVMSPLLTTDLFIAVDHADHEVVVANGEDKH